MHSKVSVVRFNLEMSFRRPVKQEYYEEEDEQTGNSPVFWYHSFSSS